MANKLPNTRRNKTFKLIKRLNRSVVQTEMEVKRAKQTVEVLSDNFDFAAYCRGIAEQSLA